MLVFSTKLYVSDDLTDRYMFTLAKTPSDFRNNVNSVSDAAKKIFGIK